jgi:hypothetical protein
MLRRNIEDDRHRERAIAQGQDDYETIAKIDRTLHALSLAFGRTWSPDGCDIRILERLDEVAKPYVSRHASWHEDVVRERTYAAEALKNWWATSLHFGIARAPEVDPDVRVEERFAHYLAEHMSTTFATLRADLPTDWRSQARLKRVRIAAHDVSEMHVDGTLKEAAYDELGEKLARLSLKAIGYPDAKVKSLFDAVSKRVDKVPPPL